MGQREQAGPDAGCAYQPHPVPVTPDSPLALINRELSWLSFARRVLALAEDPEQPLLERVKFAGIMGSIYDEFAMKRIGGLFRKVQKRDHKRGPEGLTPAEELKACRAELRSQQELVATLVEEQLRPALRDLGTPILDIGDLDPSQRDFLVRYFADTVEPILIPLAADAAHPFPFISNLGLNLAVLVTEPGRRKPRFVRIKVPASRPRWVPLPDHAGWVPLEQVIAANLSAIFPRASQLACSFFRVSRGAKDDPWTDQAAEEDADLSPGAIIEMVTAELTARKYAGVVRLEVSADMPEDLRQLARGSARRRPCRRHRHPRAAEPRGPHGAARGRPCRAALPAARAGDPSAAAESG